MNRKIVFVGIGSLLLILTIGAAVLLFARPASFRGTTYGEPFPVASEIVLARSDGSSFRLSELRGKVVLIFFGYTSCPDVCPTTMAELKLALSELDEKEAAQVKVLFVTVDPERDTPARVQEYAGRFNPDFIGLSGPQTELEKIWQAYGVYRKIADPSVENYTVDHTARVTMIDPQGNLRVSFGFDTPVEDIVHDLKLMLKQTQ